MIHDSASTPEATVCFVVVNGGWSDFGAWGECNAACGDGQQERSRTCTNPPPAHGGAECSGSSIEFRSCNNGPCKGGLKSE